MKNLAKYLSWTSLAGITMFVLLMIFAPGFAKSAESILIIVNNITLFALFDKYVLVDIDTIDQLKQGNYAYALFLVAIALLFIAAAILIS